MSTRSDMTAAGLLIADGVLKVERFGVLVRVTPESVAAYEQLLATQKDAPPSPGTEGDGGASALC